MVGEVFLANSSNNQEKFQYTICRLSEGVSIRQIAKELKVHHTTVQYWIKNNFKTNKRSSVLTQEDVLSVCNKYSADYSYILGSYLGDGHISQMPKTYRLRVFNDERYPDIISDQKRSLTRLFDGNKISEAPNPNTKCVVVSVYNNHLPLFFPQHGPNCKHTRDVSLKDWQWDMVKKEPECFIKGLIDSDGTYYTQTQKAPNGKEYIYQRYSFTNSSKNILDMVEKTLSLLGIKYLIVKRKVIKNQATLTNINIGKQEDIDKVNTLYDIAESKLRIPSSKL